MEKITSRSNGLLVHMKKLAASAAYRREQGVYLCDSPKLLAEALKWHAPVREIAVTVDVPLPPLPETVRVVEIPEDVMSSISPMKSPQGALFTVTLPETAVPEALPGSRYMVLDGVQDPGNVGTILRTLDAFDFDGLERENRALLHGGGVPPPCMVPEGGAAARPADAQQPAPVRHGAAAGHGGCSCRAAGSLRHRHRQRGTGHQRRGAGPVPEDRQDPHVAAVRVPERGHCRHGAAVGELPVNTERRRRPWRH